MDVRYLAGCVMVAMFVPAGQASAQKTHREPAHNVTLLGCVMRESDFRDTYGPGLSGVRGPGIGLKNEYMLVDATPLPDAAALTDADAAKACPAAGTSFPNAYELTGSKEKEIAEYVGKRVVLTGMQKAAKVREVGSTGQLQPTGGFDPLGHELHLFEVEPNNFHDVNAVLAQNRPAPAPAQEAVVAPAPAQEAVVEPAPAPAPEPQQEAAAPAPAPVAAPEPPAPAPVATTGQNEEPKQVAAAELPNTASPLPFIGLIGVLSLCAGAGIRLAFGRQS